MDLNSLVTRMRTDQTLTRIGRRPLAQFGTQNRPYIGAQLLPERLVDENAYRDDSVRYRTIVANAGTRYSPVQLKEGVLSGSVLVELGESDVGSELTSRDYDILVRLLAGSSDMEAASRVINFLDITVNRALIEYNEMQRWQAFVNRLIQRRGDGGYLENVNVSSPPGHILDVVTGWGNSAVDPFDEYAAACQILRDKGYEPYRAVTRSQVTATIAGNPNTKTRTGRITINGNGGGVPTLVGLGGRVTLAEINGQLQADNNPPLEVYDRRYQTNTSSGPFIPDGCMVIFGRTDDQRREEIALDNNEVEIIDGTMGYVGVGRSAGQSSSGRVIRAEHHEDKPPRIKAEGWQTSGPVIQEPEAFVSIRKIITGT